jgi:hypothetical protein
MALTVNHVFTNPVADGTITSIVRPSDWNSAHKLVYNMIDGIGVSDTTYFSGSVIFSNQANITINSSVNGASQYVQFSVGAAGLTTAMASNRGSDFVQATAGFNGTNCSGTIASNSVSVSVGNYLTTADLSANSSKYVQNWKLTGNTAGTTSSAQGTDLWFDGGNSITVSGNSNTIRLSVGAYITTARGSTDAIGLNTAGTNMTWTANSAGLSINAGGYAGTNTAATGASVTLNTSGISINLPAYLTTADLSANTSKFVQNWKLTGNTSGTTSSAQGTDLWFQGGNSLTVSGSSNSVVFSVGAYITTADLSANSSKYVQNWKLTGNTSGTTSSAQGTDLWFQGGNSLTVSGSSNSIVFSVGAYLTTAMASNRGTDFVQGTAGFNGTNCSGTIASNSISVSVGAYITTADLSANSSKYVQNWKLTGNTAGTTSSAQGTDLWFSGAGAMTVSGSSNTIVLSPPASSSLIGSSGISLSSAGSTITIYQPVASQFDPVRAAPVTNSTLGQSTLYFFPFDNGDMLSASRVNFFHSIAFTYSGAPANSTAWLAAGYGLYTRGTGASTDRISLLTSYSMAYISGSASSSTRLSVTNYWQVSNGTTHSTTQYGQNNVTAGTYLTSSIGGFRVVAFPVSSLLTPGRYWLGYSVQSSSQGASLIFGHSVMQAQFSNQLAFQPFNVVSAASNASFWDASNGFGIYSAQSAAWPNSIPLTSDSIRAALVNTVPIFNFSGISQSSNIL